MKDDLFKLRQQLAVNTVQIELLVARKHGVDLLKTASPAEYQTIRDLTGKLLDLWKDAKDEGVPEVADPVRFNELAAAHHDLKRRISDIEKK